MLNDKDWLDKRANAKPGDPISPPVQTPPGPPVPAPPPQPGG